MNKGGFQNDEEFAARCDIVARQQHIFRIGVDANFVAHAKSVAFRPKYSFGVSAKNKSSAGLREGKVEMRREAAVDWRQLLPVQKQARLPGQRGRVLLSGGSSKPKRAAAWRSP